MHINYDECYDMIVPLVFQDSGGEDFYGFKTPLILSPLFHDSGRDDNFNN